MKKIIILFAGLLASASTFGIPALGMWRSVKQSDGTMLRVMTVGDEHFSYALTEDSIPVLPSDGSYYYARVEDGRLVASSVLAHEKGQRQRSEALVAAALDEVTALQREREEHVRTRAFGDSFGRLRQGKKKGLVLLVAFEDMAFRDPKNVLTLDPRERDVKTLYEKMLNEKGYKNKNGAIGSVHDYFLDQSNGLFDLTFDVVGPITLAHPYKYYGERNGGQNDLRASQMIVDACNAVKNQVDFSQYDWDNDGVVEQVYVLYAGEGEATGGEPNTIWPHKFSLTEAGIGALSFGGYEVDTYACSNEIIRAQEGARERVYYSGIGTICHEFSHCLGLPDFYDTRGGKNIGSGRYDLMCSGSYNGGPLSLVNVYGGSGIGTIPAGYDAYEKAYMGWLEPKVLGSEAVKVDGLKGLSEGGEAYFLYNPEHQDEYYILENRTKSRWDSELPGHGLMVFHVDFDARSWQSNNVNAERYQRHPRFTIVPADGRLDKSSQHSDPFPSSLSNSLTTSTDPRLSFYTGYRVNSDAGISQVVVNGDKSVSFVYTPISGSTGISSLSADSSSATETYTLAGVKASKDRKEGRQVLIVKDKQGKVRKEF